MTVVNYRMIGVGMSGLSPISACLFAMKRVLRRAVIPAFLLAGPAPVYASPISTTFVSGADVRYSSSQPFLHLSYLYEAQRRFRVELRSGNAGWAFSAKDETGHEQFLDTSLPAAFQDEYQFDLRPRLSLFAGKYDFDFDGVPELVIGARSLGPKSNPADNTISINVFALRGNEWVRVGDMNGSIIASGNPKVFIVGNRVRIPRQWRGIVLEWAFEGGRFVASTSAPGN